MRRVASLLGACAFALIALADASAYRRTLNRVASLDPLHASSLYDCTVIPLAYESLLEVDYLRRPYALAPSLAELPEISADGLEYTYRLHAGHRFANGRAVAAEDVVYSLRRLGDVANASSGSWVMKDVASVDAVDPLAVRFRLRRPVHYFPWLTAMPYTGIVPREDVEAQGDAFGRRSYGSGPYRLAEWRRNHKLRFVRNVDWPGWARADTSAGRPVETIEFLHVEDPSTQWLMFLGGEIDYLGEVARDNWDAVVGKDGRLAPDLAARGIRLNSYSTLEVDYIGVNMDDPVLGKNRKLRQALNCAFDSNAWMRFFHGATEPADGPVPHGVEGRLETPFPYAFNLDRARALLAEAGYPGGIDPATGRRLVLTVAIGRPTQDMLESTELMASFFEKIGVVLSSQRYTWNAFVKAVSERRVQMFRMGWIGDYPDAQNFLQLFHSSNVSPGPNHSNYSDPDYDRIYESALEAKDPSARNLAWAQAQEKIREDCPWIFLAFRRNFTLLRPGIENYRPTDFSHGVEKHFRLSRE